MGTAEVVTWAVFGAIFAFLLEVFIAGRESHGPHYLQNSITAAISCSWTIVYFTTLQRPWIGLKGEICVVHYALFISFFLQAASSLFVIGPPVVVEGTSGAGVPATGAIAAIFSKSGPSISGGPMLDGFWQVFAVGVFGAFLAELLVHYKNRSKKAADRTPRYWIVTSIMVLAGGGVTTLYGTSHVSAPLAAQLGASAPLIIGRFAR